MTRPSSRSSTLTRGLVWEALAPALRWPLHSPARLGAIVAALAGVLVLTSVQHPATGPDPTPTSTSSTAATLADPGSSSAGTSASPTGLTSASSSTSAAAGGVGSGASSSPAEAAVRFVTVWARPDAPAGQWRSDVARLATPEFGAALASVLPANVPARAVTGTPALVSTSPVAAVVTVPTDAGMVLVDVALLGQGWLVSGLTPAGPGPSSGVGSSLAATYTPLPAGG